MDELTALIMSAIEKANDQTRTRETSLVVTKLEEALLWWNKAQRTTEVKQAS